ncbi:MAG: thiosulfate sulfurtransferase GlpE [Saccharospirillum sp.]|nr:thiosulfate sulfurtransferase GlpE [Saccharospirillum sp.]
MNNLTASELAAWLNDEARPQPTLLDVRESWEFQTCHIEGSVLIPMNSIPDQLSELKREQPVVCICHHGMRSMQVAHFLDQNGFSNVSNLTGGVDAWARQVDSEMPTY